MKAQAKARQQSPQENPFRSDLSPRSFKNELQKCITKFNSKDTRQQSIQDALQLMDRNFQQPKIVIQCLQEAFGKFEPPESKEAILITLAHVTTMIGKDYSPEKDMLICKIVSLNIQYFKETSKSIHQACLRVIVDLFNNCVFLDEPNYQMLVLYQPIEQILLGGSQLSAQETASFCLSTLSQYLMTTKQIKLLQEMCVPIMLMFLNQKPQVEQPHLLQTIFIISQFLAPSYQFQAVVEKVLKYVTVIAAKQKQQQTQINILIQACLYFQLLSTLHLSKRRDIDLNQLPLQQRQLVQDNLYKLTADARIQVAQIAKQSLTEWLKALSVQKSKDQDIQIQNLQAVRAQKKQEKQDQQKMDDSLEDDKQIEILNNESQVRNSESYNIDFLQYKLKDGKHIRGSNFKRKGTGSGAGQAALEQIDMEQHKPKIEPYQKRIRQLYEQIQQPERNQSAKPERNQSANSKSPKIRNPTKIGPSILSSSPKMDAILVDSLENFYPAIKAKDKIQRPSSTKQLTTQQSIKPNLIKQKSALEQLNKKLPSQIQDEFLFKSQTFELPNSNLHEFLAQEQKITSAHSNLKEEKLDKFPPLQNEQFLTVSKCFDDQFKSNCLEFANVKQVDEQAIDNFIDTQVDYIIKQNEEILKDFTKAEVGSAVYQNLDKRVPIQEVIKPIEIQQKRNYQDLIKNPPKQMVKVQQTDDLVSQEVEEQHYNLLKTKLVNRNALHQQKMQQFDKLQLQEKWMKALELIQGENYEDAYQCILRGEDDIYLVRLMSVTGPCIKKLTQETAQLLGARIKTLMVSEFWKILGLKIFTAVREVQIPVPIEEDQRMQSLLFKWSQSWQPEISYESARLYNSQSLHDQ